MKRESKYASCLIEANKEIEQKQTLIDSLILAAQTHAQEARTANATIYEIYQYVSGSTGEPGNWHGAQPVRDAFEKLQAQLDEAINGWKESVKAFDDIEKELEDTQAQLATARWEVLSQIEGQIRTNAFIRGNDQYKERNALNEMADWCKEQKPNG